MELKSRNVIIQRCSLHWICRLCGKEMTKPETHFVTSLLVDVCREPSSLAGILSTFLVSPALFSFVLFVML